MTTVEGMRVPVGGGTRASADARSAVVDRSLVLLIEDIPEAFVLYDATGRIAYANHEFRRRMGRTSDQLVGRRPFEWDTGHFADSAEVVRFRALLGETLATGEPRDFTRSQPGLDGRLQTYRVSFRAQRDGGGSIIGAYMYAQDMSDLDQARQQVASQEEEFRLLTESLPDVIVRYDAEGRAVYANHGVGTPDGLLPAAVLGRRPREVDHPGVHDKEAFDARLMEVLGTGEPGQITLTFDTAQGRTILSVLIRAERDARGSVCGAFVIGRDVTDIVAARNEAAQREREFRTLAENLPDVVLRYDATASLTYVNGAYERELALPRPALGTRGVFATCIDDVQAGEFERLLAAVLADGVPNQLELRIRGPVRMQLAERDDVTDADHLPGDGERVYSVAIRPERDDSGRVVGALALARDVTLLVRTRQRAEASERRFRSLTENATEFIGRWAPDGRRLYANPALVRLLCDDGEAVRAPRPDGGAGAFAEVLDRIRRCAAHAAPTAFEHAHHHPEDGSRHVYEVQLVPEFDEEGTVMSVLGVGRDVTTVVTQREELERASRTDSLTGAANRRVLYDALPGALAAAAGSDRHVALLLADLDGFKHLNDQYGHTYGDRLLCAVADTLTACTGRPPIRLGGDEFALLADVASAGDAAELARSIQAALARLHHEGTRFPPVDVSFGVSISPHDGREADVLLAAADMALYAAKRQGRGRVEFYRADLRTAAERRSAIEDALRGAVPDAQMELHLQPICSLHTGRVWGVEALLRWRHPTLGVVPPTEFIPVAEHSGQIVPLGRWVLARAAAIAVELNADRAEPMIVCVNVSTRQFTLDDVVQAVVEALRTTGCDPRWLSLELTESLLLEDLPLVTDAITRLRELGVGIAIDDFGTGYSALHYLTKLRIDHMKIDKAFVHDVETDAQQQEVVRALIALADAIGVAVIAEGIETPAQAAFLRSLGCALGQGYLLARPLPPTDLTAWLSAGARSVATPI